MARGPTETKKNQAIGAACHHDLGTPLHGHNDVAPDHIFSTFQLCLTNSE